VAAFTFSAVAAATRLADRGLAKVVALRDDEKKWLIAVLPAYLAVDLGALAVASGRRRLTLASEVDVVREFGVSELGDAVPFSELSGRPVYLDEAFGAAAHIYFQDGTHQGVFGLRLRDYLRLAKPTVVSFGIPGVVDRDAALGTPFRH
jgi:prolyl-tRNA editing enzyme YbaK/EbsC (Cys-tRNA(Pro) deacylase)